MTQILHAVQATLELFHVIISQAAKTYDVNLLRNTILGTVALLFMTQY